MNKLSKEFKESVIIRKMIITEFSKIDYLDLLIKMKKKRLRTEYGVPRDKFGEYGSG